MDQKILDISVQKKINNYLINAYPLCVINGDNNLVEWFYENYIQVFFNPRKECRYNEYEVWLDFYGGITKPREILNFQLLNDNTFFEALDIMQFTEENINNNNYIFTYFDEYFVKPNYQKNNYHFVHDILIYGYDSSKQEIYVVGFDDNRVFTNYKITYDLFCRAFKSGLEISKKNDIWKNSVFYALLINKKERTDLPYRFNRERFKKNLHSYINSVNSYQEESGTPGYISYPLYEYKENIYGIKLYDEYIRYLYDVINNKTSFYYPTVHTLFEHKSAIMEQFNFIITKYDKSGVFRNLAAEWNEVLNTFNVIRFKAIKYHLSGQNELLKEIISSIENITAIESHILTALYEEC